jgi:hypothetical protein
MTINNEKDLGLFNQQEINKIAESLLEIVSAEEKFTFSLDNHQPHDEEFTAGSYWTVSAQSNDSGLKVTMIVRGNPWWTTSKLWLTKDGTRYTCSEDTFKTIPAFKNLESFFMDKANSLGQEMNKKQTDQTKQQDETSDAAVRNEASQLIASLEKQKK